MALVELNEAALNDDNASAEAKTPWQTGNSQSVGRLVGQGVERSVERALLP